MTYAYLVLSELRLPDETHFDRRDSVWREGDVDRFRYAGQPFSDASNVRFKCVSD